MAIPTIQDECHVLQEQLPDFADILLQAIEEKRISGLIYGYAGGPGNVYAHLGKFDLSSSELLWRHVNGVLGQPKNAITPIEQLVANVSQGQSRAEIPALQQLYECLLSYRTSGVDRVDRQENPTPPEDS